MEDKEVEKMILTNAINKFGQAPQKIKAIEEMGELIQALSKDLNLTLGEIKTSKFHDVVDNVIEEIADVSIMLGQLKILFGGDIIEAKIMEKLLRLDKLCNPKAYISMEPAPIPGCTCDRCYPTKS